MKALATKASLRARERALGGISNAQSPRGAGSVAGSAGRLAAEESSACAGVLGSCYLVTQAYWFILVEQTNSIK